MKPWKVPLNSLRVFLCLCVSVSSLKCPRCWSKGKWCQTLRHSRMCFSPIHLSEYSETRSPNCSDFQNMLLFVFLFVLLLLSLSLSLWLWLIVDCWLLIVDCWLFIVDCWLLIVVVVVVVDSLSLQLFLYVLEGHQPEQLRCNLEHSSCSHQVHTFFAFQACKAGSTEFFAFGIPIGHCRLQ